MKGALLPEWIGIEQATIEGEKPTYQTLPEAKEDFSAYADFNRLQTSPFQLPALFNPLFPAGSLAGLHGGKAAPNGLRLYPVMDDRMFVVCWYEGKEHLPQDLFTPSLDFSQPGTVSEASRDLWYQYVFLDHDGPTSVNDRFTRKLLDEATYTRWSGSGSLFGVTRYSMVAITGFPPLKQHMETIYYKMAELCLVQRALMLRFSDEATHFSRRKLDKLKPRELRGLEGLQQNYLRFINKIYFREVTAQEQGLEMYDMLQRTLRLPEQIKDLEHEIETLYQYGQLAQEERRNQQLDTITWVGGLLLLPALLLAFLGITELQSANVSVSGQVEWLTLGAAGLMTLAGLIIFAIRYLKSR